MQLAHDHLRHPQVLGRVPPHRDAAAVVAHRYAAGLVDLDIDRSRALWVALAVVERVDQDLIEDLVQPRVELHAAPHHALRLVVVQPHALRHHHRRPDVHTGAGQHMLMRCQPLVDLLLGRG